MPNPSLGEKLVYRTKGAKMCDDVGAGINTWARKSSSYRRR